MTSARGAAGAMIWKEARENLKWAVLGLLAMAAGLAYVLADGSYVNEGSPLVSETLLVVTTVGGAAIALLLALAQVLPEKRPDQWAFLVHRPVSRTWLFFAKAVTGLGLYALAVGVPFACAVAWVATPGHVPAPFDRGMILPGLADLLAGVGYYFAGMVVGLREARWYGSRVLAVGLAVLCSFVVVFAPEFGHALLAIVVGVAILGTAAWGSFLAAGHYAPQPRLAKAALGTALFVGIILGGGPGVVAVSAMLPQPPQPDWVYTHYALDRDGRVLRFTRTTQQLVSVTDPGGDPVSGYAGIDLQTFQTRLAEPAEATLWFDADRRLFAVLNSYRRPERFYFRMPSPPVAPWYYVHRQRYLVGYDVNATRIGYLTPAGFHPGPAAPADRFEGQVFTSWLWTPNAMLAFPSGAFKPDVAARRLDRAFVPPPGERLVAAATAFPPPVAPFQPNFNPKPAFDVFATTAAVHVHAPDGRPLFSTPLEHGAADGFAQLGVSRQDEADRFYLWYYGPWYATRGRAVPQRVTELTAAGEVVARHELPPVPPLARPAAAPAASMLVGAASPSVGLATATVLLARFNGEPPGRVLGDPDTRTAMLAALVSGLACAAVTLGLARRYTFGRRAGVGWAVGNVLLGPAGVLTMLALRGWPTRETCPACGRRRVVGRERCPRCAAAPEPPPLDGTEIFAV